MTGVNDSVRATTREIARAAGVSEGSLYNHFESKEALFLALLKELPGEFVQVVMRLPSQAGHGTVQERLDELVRAALTHYRQTLPMGSSILTDSALLERHRALLREQGAGPHRANQAMAAYLRAEQELGRVRADVDPDTVSYMLLGACLQYVYWTTFMGESSFVPPEESFARELVATVVRALAPAGE
ncbi:MAG: TetR/AcrR family transcriptional regulator [Thermoanaerobaculia bacterium]